MHERDVYKHNMLAVFLYNPDKQEDIHEAHLSRCGSDFYFWMGTQSHETKKITLKDIFQLKSISSYDVVLAKIMAGEENIKLTEKGYNIIFKTISPNEILCIVETADTLFKKSFFQFHQMVVELTIKIASLPFGKIPEGIDHVLEKMGHFMEADRVYIVEYTPDYNHKSMMYEWCQRGIGSLMKEYNEQQVSFYPWERKFLSPGEHVHIPDVTRIPLEESKGENIFLSEGIHAVLLLPMQIHENVLGYIGFHSKNNGWTEENIKLLNTLAQLITNAIIRRKTEEKFLIMQKAISNSSDAFMVIDQNASIVDVNYTTCERLGYTYEELTRLKIPDIDPGYKEKYWDEHWDEQVSKEHFLLESRHKTKTGKIIPVEINGVFIKIGENKYYAVLVRDISERKKAEEDLLVSEIKYRNLFNSITDPVLIFDKNTWGFMDCNQAAYEKYGYTLEEFNEMTPYDFHVKEEHPLVKEDIEKIDKTGPNYHNHITKKGKKIPVEVYNSPIEYNGKPAFVCMVRDITDRIQIEKDLVTSEEKLQKQAGILQKRLHELMCFYQIEEYINQKNINEDDFFTKVIDVLWQSSLKPEIEMVKIQIKEKVIQKGQLSNDTWEIRVPVYVNKRKSGSLVVWYKPELDHEGFAELESNEEALLHNIAKKVGFFMERKREELLRYAISKINESINISSNVNQLCISLRKILSGLIHANSLKLQLYNEKENVLRQYGYNNGKVITGKKIPKNSPEYRIISQQESLLYKGDCNEDNGIRWPQNISSYLGIPIKIGNKVIGVISVRSKTPDEIFDENDLEMVEVISNSVGVAITKKQAEEEIRKLYLSVEQSPALIIITDMAGKIQYVNPKFEEHTGYTSSEVTGKNPSILKSGNKKKEEYKHIWDTILAGDVWKGEFLNRKKNGELYWELALISPIKDEAGYITHFIGIKEDITSRKKMEEELLFAKERAEESDRLKSTFLATMSHELRTPLNAVIGFSDLIKESQEIQRIKQFAETINSSGVHLLNLIEEIFDLSIIESGGVKIYKEDFKLYPVLVGIYDIMLSERMISKKDHIEFQLKVPAKFRNIIIYTDQQRLKQIFLNLLKNALKFTSEGAVEYGIKSIKEGDITFFIRDTGSGISREKQEIIFDMFRQGDEGDTSNAGGAGLGLFIVKKLVALLQGNVWLHSKAKEGSTFYFTIPQQEIPGLGVHDKAGEQGVSLDDWSDKIILVAEDMESNYSLLESMLEITGAKIMWAKNGKEAVETCKANDQISLVLMDIKMPLMSGFDATKEIKSFRKDLPILAQTAYAMSGDKEKAILAGCDDYISKPIGMGELIRKMRKFM